MGLMGALSPLAGPGVSRNPPDPEFSASDPSCIRSEFGQTLASGGSPGVILKLSIELEGVYGANARAIESARSVCLTIIG